MLCQRATVLVGGLDASTPTAVVNIATDLPPSPLSNSPSLSKTPEAMSDVITARLQVRKAIHAIASHEQPLV